MKGNWRRAHDVHPVEDLVSLPVFRESLEVLVGELALRGVDSHWLGSLVPGRALSLEHLAQRDLQTRQEGRG
jgi:hypothetical protein